MTEFKSFVDESISIFNVELAREKINIYIDSNKKYKTAVYIYRK